jgi:hypothetical protein
MMPVECVYLQPLLSHHHHYQPVSVAEFLVVRELQTVFAHSDMRMDTASRVWFTQDIPRLTEQFFGVYYARFFRHVRFQIEHLHQWLPPFLCFLSGWEPEDWDQLDNDTKRLWVLLDYEYPSAWDRILRNAKYHIGLAKMILLSLVYSHHSLLPP